MIFFISNNNLYYSVKYKNCERIANLFAIHSMRTIFINNNSDLSYRVDIIDYNNISEEFKQIIDSGSEITYSRSFL